MAVILSFSSQVVRGHVGNSAGGFAMQALGHEFWALPSVLLSSHPGHEHFGGARLGAKILRPIIEALDMGGLLSRVDALITGYLPTREHVFLAADLAQMVKAANPQAVYLLDPSMGEDARPGRPEGLFIDNRAAELQRTELMPRADFITPNRFELEWLAMRPVLDEASVLEAIAALGAPGRVLASSIPAGGDNIANMLAGAGGAAGAGGEAVCSKVEKLLEMPQGTGDLLAAFFLAALLDGLAEKEALGLATARLDIICRASAGLDEPALIPTMAQWRKAEPLAVEAAG
jgi:pyridoxine kinase